ncbi:MAG: hypothetical protein KIT35_02070 [Piscinibacter sp.]|uniref:hypothetical protein n=1 Tax=Piscinibacter sp. TaxID=1903157 RepID=UPI002586DDCB|nr:hypothetical protein [Piscinibacter sp.]MCW5662595.1 hypothetical protein [Piscinibacter sp.]
MKNLLLPLLFALLAACGEAPSGTIANAPDPASVPAPAPAEAIATAPPASVPEGWFRARLAAASGGDIEFLVDGQVRLEPDPAAPATRWRMVGRQVLSVVWLRCTPTASPAEQPLADAWLEIDRSSSPPRYTLRAGQTWDATVSGGCPGLPGTASVPMRVPGRLEVSGTLSPDGRAAGERRDGDLVWTWSLPTRP